MNSNSNAFSPSLTILERFDLAWQQHGYPDILAHLPPPSQPTRRATLIDLVRIDMEYRWKAENGCLVEGYLECFPELRNDQDAILDLIVWEYELRRRIEPGLDVQEYARRFPESATRLASRLAEIDTCLSGVSEQRGSEKSTPPSIPGYEILDELGRGGMGVVYRARQVSLDRLVALKVIRADSSDHPTMRQRFAAEARAIARLDHVGIVRVYDSDIYENQLYFVLEYVGGGNLGQLLRRGPLPPRLAARLVAGLAEAVQHAHDNGIVHRDLKPANVLIAAPSADMDSATRGDPDAVSPVPPQRWLHDAQFKITDFGLARSIGTMTQTVAGAYLGTPAYMSPEQARGDNERVGPCTDVFGLGAILYECLTGQPPIRGASYDEVLDQARRGTIAPPRSLVPTVPAGMERICLRALDPDPTHRQPSARALANELHRYLRRRWLLAGTALFTLLLSALTILVISLLPRGDAPPSVRMQSVSFLMNRQGMNDQGWLDVLQSQEKALPIRNGDLFSIGVMLDHPGHLYIVYIEGNGRTIPLYPWNNGDPRLPPESFVTDIGARPKTDEPTRRILSPNYRTVDPKQKFDGWPMEGASSFDTILLLARANPIPSTVRLKELIRPMAVRMPENRAELRVRSWPTIRNLMFDYRGGELTDLRGAFGPERGPGIHARAADDGLMNVLAPLLPHFDGVMAIQFTHEGS